MYQFQLNRLHLPISGFLTKLEFLLVLGALLVCTSGDAEADPVYSQSGISFNGIVEATPLGDNIIMSENSAFPVSTNLGSFAFRGGITIEGYLYLLANESDEIVKVELATGNMTAVALPDLGGAYDKFVGGVYDGTYIWLVPRDADAVVRLDPSDDSTTRFNDWPAGFTKGPAAFSGGIFDGTYIWMTPHDADRVIRLDPSDGSMVGYNTWPAGFTKGPAAFWGAIFDGTSMWMAPFNADRVVKIDTTTGVMTGYNAWPANYTLPTRAFAGGTFDGTSVWLAAYDSDRIISIDTATGAMTGYGTAHDATQWPAGYTKMPGNFNGAIYDGEDVWFVPFESADLIKVDGATGAISSYLNYPPSIYAPKLDKWAGAGFDGEKIYLVPGVEMTLVTIESTPVPAVTSILRQGPAQEFTNSGSVVFRVKFNKNVSNVDVSDFALTTTGTATGSITSVSASTGTTIDVTLNSVAGDGSLRLDLNAGGTGIEDDFGYAIGGGFTTGEAYQIDNTVPGITSGGTETTTYRDAYTHNITVSGGPASVFEATGLPVGLSLDPGTGVISGAASQVGSFDVMLTATDAAGNEDSAELTVEIEKAALSILGVTAENKTYDRSDSAVLSFDSASLVGVVDGDDVTIDSGAATGMFPDKNVGTGKTVTITGISLAGAHAGNYTLTQPTASADIAKKNLSVTGVTALDRVYDGTVVAALNVAGAAIPGVFSGDAVTLVTSGASGSFASKHIGASKPVTVSDFALTGADAVNYLLTQPTATATISSKPLTVSGLAVVDKVYDGTPFAAVDVQGAALEGAVPGDDVLLGVGSVWGSFADKHVGVGQTVAISGVTLGGADAGNYELMVAPGSGSIAPKALTVAGITVADKVYDASTAANIDVSNASLAGVVAGDDIVLAVGLATAGFADKAVGADKAVAVGGLNFSGADAGNYTLTLPTLAASIVPKTLVVDGITASDTIYDGSTIAQIDVSGATLEGVLPGDLVGLDVAGAAGFYGDASAGVEKTVSISGLTLVWADAPNYVLTPPTATASILPKEVTIFGMAARNKVYDGTVAAEIDASGAILMGVQAGDDVSLDASSAVGEFADASVGASKEVTITGVALVGADAGNYSGVSSTASAAIAQATASVSLSDLNQTYDGMAKQVTVSTVPEGLSVSITYNDSETPPTEVGSYDVQATITDTNYLGTTLGTLIVDASMVSVTITETEHRFDGLPKPVRVDTDPAGVAFVTTYDGDTAPPSSIGEYEVVVTVTDSNYSGGGNATLVIERNSRVTNLSTRAWVGSGDQVVIPGFVVEGSSPKALLIRGIGPHLTSFGVEGALEAPVLTLYSGETEVASNSGWSTAANASEISEISASVGAFPLPNGSADSVLFESVDPGFYTVHFSGVGGVTGTGLIEVYDVDGPGSSSRLTNMSARAVVGSGGDVLIPGCVVDGIGPRRLLIRAAGPSLQHYGVDGFLEDPQITVLSGGVEIASNDDWSDVGNLAELVEATSETGAFPFGEGLKDSAILISLEPGAYTFRISGVDGATGVALVEVFEVE